MFGCRSTNSMNLFKLNCLKFTANLLKSIKHKFKRLFNLNAIY